MWQPCIQYEDWSLILCKFIIIALELYFSTVRLSVKLDVWVPVLCGDFEHSMNLISIFSYLSSGINSLNEWMNTFFDHSRSHLWSHAGMSDGEPPNNPLHFRRRYVPEAELGSSKFTPWKHTLTRHQMWFLFSKEVCWKRTALHFHTACIGIGLVLKCSCWFLNSCFLLEVGQNMTLATVPSAVCVIFRHRGRYFTSCQLACAAEHALT